MTEAEEFQARLLQKIEEWKNTEDFKKSTSAKQKLERSANLVAGTQPEVLVELLGPSASIPDENRKAMQMVRTMDEKTLNALQIFTLTGQQTKLVGHHEVPANILGQHLRKMPVEARIEVFRNLYDRGIRSGMDPKQIRLLPAMVHYTIAHRRDFTGKKTGALLPVIEGESVNAFLKRFDKALDVTFEMAQEAADAPLTQAWNAAMRGATEGIGVGTDIPLGAPETPMEFRALATKAFKPIASKVQTTVLENLDDPARIQETVAELTKTEGAVKPQLVEQLQQQAPAARQAIFDFKNGVANLKFQAPEIQVPTPSIETPQFSNRLIGTKAARFVPGLGVTAGLSAMGERARAGDFEGVAGEGIAAAVGEVPIAGDILVTEAEGRAAGKGSAIPQGMTPQQYTQMQIKQAKNAKTFEQKVANELSWAAKNPGEVIKNVAEAGLSTALSAGQAALDNPMLMPYTSPLKAIGGAMKLFGIN